MHSKKDLYFLEDFPLEAHPDRLVPHPDGEMENSGTLPLVQLAGNLVDGWDQLQCTPRAGRQDAWKQWFWSGLFCTTLGLRLPDAV